MKSRTSARNSRTSGGHSEAEVRGARRARERDPADLRLPSLRMPVCEEHGWVVLTDDAFDEAEEPMSRSAMHCPECAAEYHPRGASKRRGWVVRRPRAAAGQEARRPRSPRRRHDPGLRQPRFARRWTVLHADDQAIHHWPGRLLGLVFRLKLPSGMALVSGRDRIDVDEILARQVTSTR